MRELLMSSSQPVYSLTNSDSKKQNIEIFGGCNDDSVIIVVDDNVETILPSHILHVFILLNAEVAMQVLSTGCDNNEDKRQGSLDGLDNFLCRQKVVDWRAT
eukprot:10319824-Ditylum_brightwellii.AAC.1